MGDSPPSSTKLFSATLEVSEAAPIRGRAALTDISIWHIKCFPRAQVTLLDDCNLGLAPRQPTAAESGILKGPLTNKKSVSTSTNHRSDHHGALRRRQSPFQIETTARLLRDLIIPKTHGQLSGESAWQHLATSGHAWSHQHLDLRCFYGRISHPASSCSECDTQSLRSLCLETAELQSGGDPSWTGIPPRSIETWKKK